MRRDAILLIAALVIAIAVPIHARADLSQKQARKVIQTMGGWALPNDSVRIRSMNSSGTEGVEVSAEIEAVFRLRLSGGHWQLQEIRTAPDRWERLAVIVRAAKVELPAGGCDTPAQIATTLTTKRARCLVAALFGVTLPSDQVRIKEVSPFGLSIGKESAALVTALVNADFRLARNAGGWRVTGFKTGTRDWVDVSDLPLAIDQVKRTAASDDLSIIAKALSDFRRDRGYFVVADKESVLIDHLSPKYLARVIRVDPWYRPYQYDGQQDHYSLRSFGPDGKPNTPDDVVVSGP
jgi:Type II secretion system (T2SS), protein G